MNPEILGLASSRRAGLLVILNAEDSQSHYWAVISICPLRFHRNRPLIEMRRVLSVDSGGVHLVTCIHDLEICRIVEC